jgi:thiosulfate/3-mercaptopyruvate sulfurtransferase
MIQAPLIAGEELARLMSSGDRRPSILDVRWQLATGADRGAYREAHIPGAAFVDLDRQLADPPSQRGRHPLPSAERFSEAMQACGVSITRPVIVYDAATSMAAARAWWLLRYYGHPEAAVLDGGLAAWVAGGGVVEGGEVSPVRGDFVAVPGGMPVIDAKLAAQLAVDGVLLDARAEERFAGLVEPVDPVGGHIPGARNRPTSENLDSEGRFLRADRLRTAFSALGVRDGLPLATYCGSGVTAAHELLALEIAGYRGALYPGSWSEWITDPSRPIARSAPDARRAPRPRADRSGQAGSR